MDFNYTERAGVRYADIEDLDTLISNVKYPENYIQNIKDSVSELYLKIIYALATSVPGYTMPCDIKISSKHNLHERYPLYTEIASKLIDSGIVLEQLYEDRVEGVQKVLSHSDKKGNSNNTDMDIMKPSAGNHVYMSHPYLTVCDSLRNCTSLEEIREKSRTNLSLRIPPRYLYIRDLVSYDDLRYYEDLLHSIKSDLILIAYVPYEEHYRVREYMSGLNFDTFEKLSLTDLTTSSNFFGYSWDHYSERSKAFYKYLTDLNKDIYLDADIEKKKFDISNREDSDTTPVKVIYRVLALYCIVSGRRVQVTNYNTLFDNYLHQFMSYSGFTMSQRLRTNLLSDYMVYYANNLNAIHICKFESISSSITLRFQTLDYITSGFRSNSVIRLEQSKYRLQSLKILDTVDYLLELCNKSIEREGRGDFGIVEQRKHLDSVCKEIVGGLSKGLYGFSEIVSLKDILFFESNGKVYVGFPTVDTKLMLGIYDTQIDAKQIDKVVLEGNPDFNLIPINSCVDYENICKEFGVTTSGRKLEISEDICDNFIYGVYSDTPSLMDFTFHSNHTLKGYLYNKAFNPENSRIRNYLIPTLNKFLSLEACFRQGVVTPYGGVRYSGAEGTSITINNTMFESYLYSDFLGSNYLEG